MDKLKPLLSRVFRVRPELITDGAAMKDIPGWDSLSHMDLIVSLEDEFHIELTGDEIADMRSVQAIRDLLNQRGALNGHQG